MWLAWDCSARLARAACPSFFKIRSLQVLDKRRKAVFKTYSSDREHIRTLFGLLQEIGEILLEVFCNLKLNKNKIIFYKRVGMRSSGVVSDVR